MEKHTSLHILKKVGFLKRQKSPKWAMSLSFLVLFVSLLNFSGAFYSLVAD